MPTSATLSQNVNANDSSSTLRRKKRTRSLCNHIVHTCSSTLSKVLRGDVAPIVPADLYGQTLVQEIAECPFRHENLWLFQNDDGSLDFSVERKKQSVGNHWDDLYHQRKLYGGAQYHRALSQFHFLIHTVPIDRSTSDEIALLLHGISGENHDGNDILRSVAKLSSVKIESIMSDILDDMIHRVEYVLLRMWEIVEYTLLVREEDSHSVLATSLYSVGKKNFANKDIIGNGPECDMETKLLAYAKEVYTKFVMEKCQFCYNMVREDLKALFRFVSWDLAFGDRFLSTIGVDGCIIPMEGMDEDDVENGNECGDKTDISNHQGHSQHQQKTSKSPTTVVPKPRKILDPTTDGILQNVVQAVQTSASRIGTGGTMPQTCAAINVLVQYVTESWRRDVSQILMTKFNAYCMLPLHEEFLGYLRREMDNFVHNECLD
jgi:hypothetical protein